MPSAVDRLAEQLGPDALPAQWRREHATPTPTPARKRSAVDYRLDDLTIVSRGTGAPERDLNLAGSITSADLELTIEGASVLTIQVEDPDGALRNSDYLTRWAWGNGTTADESEWIRTGRAVDVELDGFWFRLAQIKKSRTQLTLVFEDRDVALLRLHKGAKKVSRGKVTRAEFAKSLADEVKAYGGVDFVAPELHVRQPIGKATERISDTERADNAEPGIDSTDGLTVKGVKADDEQLRNMQRVLDVARTHKAPHRAAVALVEACIAESLFRNLTGGDSSSVGILQLLDIHLGGSVSTHGGRRDIELVAKLFLTSGFSGFGGAISLAKNYPKWTPGAVAAHVQGNAAGDASYDPWESEAESIVAAYGGGGGRPSTETYAKTYEFTRGKAENSWDAMLRLANEVNWRRFMRRGRLWFVSEEWLFRQRATARLREGENGVDWIDWDLDDQAAGDVVECTVTARADRWAVLPGQLVIVTDQGPAHGRWLVSSLRRKLTDATGAVEVTLRKPLTQKKEPAHDIATRKKTGANADFSGAADGTWQSVYAAAQVINRKGYPYVWGGGHAHAGTPDGGTGRDPGIGYDCSGSCGAVLAAAGMGFHKGDSVYGSGTFATSWGKPGKGKHMTVWANGEHVWIEFHDLSRRFDTSPHGSGPSGPHLRPMNRSTAGFTPRHWPGN